jgi:hypothetical protein
MGVSQEPLVVGCFSYWRGALYGTKLGPLKGDCVMTHKSSNSIGG